MSPLDQIRDRIARAEQRFGRRPGSVHLVAVSKTRTSSEILAMAGQGQRSFGENYLQEAFPKLAELAGQALEWHYIGNVQSNKTQAIAGAFDWVHTVDRDKIAQRLDDARDPASGPLQLCIQVNISGESTKGGVAPADLPRLADYVVTLANVRLRGLMALPAPQPTFEQQRAGFRKLTEAFTQLQRRGFALDTLSMGTSDDFEAAIAEGATLVRIGSSLFGPRPPKLSAARSTSDMA